MEFKATALIFTMVDRLPMAHSNIASNFNCKVVAIKQPTPPLTTRNTNISSPNILDVSQIEIAAGLRSDFSLFLKNKFYLLPLSIFMVIPHLTLVKWL